MQASLPPASVPHRGFTLIEMMVTLAVLGVVLGLGVPALQGLRAGFAASAQADELASMLRHARSEALRRGLAVSVCASPDPDASAPVCSGGTDWTAGWIAFQDRNANGSLDMGERVLRVHSVLGHVSAVTADAGIAAVRFGANGLALSGDGRLLVLPLTASGTDLFAQSVRTLCMGRQGRVSVHKGEVASC